MNSEEIEEQTLMLVEDPRETIETMCPFKDKIVTWDQFKNAYEEKIGRTNNPVSIGTVDTHFYTLTQFNLLIPTQEKATQYMLSSLGKRICRYLREPNIQEYKKCLRNILLNNEKKGPLFRAFLRNIRSKKSSTKHTLGQYFKSVTLRSLISWSLEAGLIEYDRDKDLIWCLRTKPKTELLLEEFWEKLVNLYKELQRTDIFLIEKVFVDITEIRANFCAEENWELDDFDENLRNVLKSRYGKKIRLYGGPSSIFVGKRNFVYKGKIYAYIRIKV